MDINVKSKNCDVTPRLKEEVTERVTHATRFFDRLLDVDVVFSEEHNPRIAEPAVVEITARSKGHYVRAQGCATDHRGAVDVAVARFERQLSRYKARQVDRVRRGERHAAPMPAPSGNGQLTASPPSAEEAWPRPRIVRTKRFDLQPLLPDDAAIQLELLGHEFFLFTNASSGTSSVVYRRRDGELGLIEGVPPSG